MEGIQPGHLKELLEQPSNCSAFKWYLEQTNIETIRAAIAGLDDNETAKKNTLERSLKKLLEAQGEQVAATETRQTRAVNMDLTTLQADRDQQQAVQTEQADREKRIAEAYEIAGQIQALTFVEKVVNVTTLVRLKVIKESKAYRDLPRIGTWEKYCEYLGIDRHTIDERLRQLNVFGEQFMVTATSFGVGFKNLRQLRQLTHDGSVVIEGECLRIPGDEPIPINEDHAEELQVAIERIITSHDDTKKRLTRLEKDMRGVVKEEVAGLESEKKALLERVKTLQQYEPKPIDETRFAEQYQEINALTASLATKISMLTRMDNLKDNPVLMARVEGYVESASGLIERLRDEWTDQLQFENN